MLSIENIWYFFTTGRKRKWSFYASHINVFSKMLVFRFFKMFSRSDKPERPIVILYGHKLDGNLKALFNYANEKNERPYDLYYATFDEEQYEELKKKYQKGILYTLKSSHLKIVMHAKCVITTHGPAGLLPLHWLNSKVHFVDVWHGIPFANYYPREFKHMRFYTACFVSSEKYKEIYQKFRGFREDQIKVTGFARHDIYQKKESISKDVQQKLKLDEYKHRILYATTSWTKEYRRNVIPFGLDAETFFEGMNKLSRELDSVTILRMHLNTDLQFDMEKYSNLAWIPQNKFLETNELLTAVDLLITDWSSIASDFVPMERPIVFLNNPMPDSYHEERPLPMERGGFHVTNISELEEAITDSLTGKGPYIHESQKKMRDVILGDKFDGKACERCDEEIRRIVLN